MNKRGLASLTPVLGLTLLLVLSVPALAHHKPWHEGGGGRGTAPGQLKEKKPKKEKKHDGREAKGKATAPGQTKDKGARGKGRERGTKGGNYLKGSPGNNGTIKIDGQPYDTSKGQEAHVGCEFRVLYWGADVGDSLDSTLTFEAHPPTGGPFAATYSAVLSGNEPHVAGPYNLVAGLRASGIEPHPKQGWHVKLTTHTEYSQGADVKHKVFWIKCDEAPGLTDKSVKGTAVLARSSDREDAGSPPEQGEGVYVGAAGEVANDPASVLPFTGADISRVLAIALVLIAAGALLLQVGRAQRGQRLPK